VKEECPKGARKKWGRGGKKGLSVVLKVWEGQNKGREKAGKGRMRLIVGKKNKEEAIFPTRAEGKDQREKAWNND